MYTYVCNTYTHFFPPTISAVASHSLGTGGTHTSITRQTMAIRGKSTTVTTTTTTTTTSTTKTTITTAITPYAINDLDIDDKGLRESRRWHCLADGHAHSIAQCLDAPARTSTHSLPLFVCLVTAHFLLRDLTDVCSGFLTVSRRVC